MLKLKRTPIEPKWIDLLPGVRAKVWPPSVASLLAARDAAALVYREAGDVEDPEIGTKAAIAMVRSVALSAIVEWEGIGDAEGEPAPVTPENVSAAMDHWHFYEAVDRLVMSPALTPASYQVA